MKYINSVKNFINSIDIDKIKKTFADKGIPLEERWEAFKGVENLLPNKSYGDGELTIIDRDVSPYDDFWIERYNTTTYSDLYERIVEKNEYNSELVKQWQETILASGYGSFTYDW